MNSKELLEWTRKCFPTPGVFHRLNAIHNYASNTDRRITPKDAFTALETLVQMGFLKRSGVGSKNSYNNFVYTRIQPALAPALALAPTKPKEHEKCKHCGLTFPGWGRHNKKRWGHTKEACNLNIIESVLKC